jgi:hypothetical protein
MNKRGNTETNRGGAHAAGAKAIGGGASPVAARAGALERGEPSPASRAPALEPGEGLPGAELPCMAAVGAREAGTAVGGALAPVGGAVADEAAADEAAGGKAGGGITDGGEAADGEAARKRPMRWRENLYDRITVPVGTMDKIIFVLIALIVAFTLYGIAKK